LSCDSAEEEEEQEDVPAESPEPDEVPEPSTVQEARASPLASEWESALQDEWNALVANETFTLIPQHEVPRGRTVIPSKVVFKVKRNRDNSIKRFKCRIGAKGFRQRPGLDFHEVFSPTVSKVTIRLLLAIAARLQWEVDHVDVKNAFLAADLKEEIYMSPPPGISCVDRDGNVLVCLLHKSIYGLKQSPREFNELLDAAMKAAGLSRSESDPCLYILSDKDGAVLALVVTYVDDILVAGKQRSLVDHVRAVADALRLSVADGRLLVARIVGRDTDTLNGGQGADTYLFALGDGVETINNYDNDSSADTVRFTDVASTAITGIIRAGDNLILAPPFVAERAHIDRMVETLRTVLSGY
jgi:hypothetical protein